MAKGKTPSHALLKTVKGVGECSSHNISYNKREDYRADEQSEVRASTSLAAAPMTPKVADWA